MLLALILVKAVLSLLLLDEFHSNSTLFVYDMYTLLLFFSISGLSPILQFGQSLPETSPSSNLPFPLRLLHFRFEPFRPLPRLVRFPSLHDPAHDFRGVDVLERVRADFAEDPVLFSVEVRIDGVEGISEGVGAIGGGSGIGIGGILDVEVGRGAVVDCLKVMIWGYVEEIEERSPGGGEDEGVNVL